MGCSADQQPHGHRGARDPAASLTDAHRADLLVWPDPQDHRTHLDPPYSVASDLGNVIYNDIVPAPRRKICADCGELCTSVRCRSCSTKHRWPTITHGRRAYLDGKCKCNVCESAELAYRNKATCADCGKPCQPSKPQRGWTPPAESRCRACASAHRAFLPPKPLCACGREMEHTSKQCKACRETGQGRRRQQVSQLNTSEWRRLRAEVIQQEPRCKIRLTGCTGHSETADHIQPVKLRPDLKYARFNLQGACRLCNIRKKALTVAQARAKYGMEPRRSRTLPEK